MKTWLRAAYAVGMVLVLAACADPVRDELITYVNEFLVPMAELEAAALDGYASVTGENYTDDWSLYVVIVDETIPAYRQFIDELEAIVPELETDTIHDLHETYIAAANEQMAGFIMLSGALETQDSVLISDANDRLTEGRRLMRQYNTKLETLIEEKGLVLAE